MTHSFLNIYSEFIIIIKFAPINYCGSLTVFRRTATDEHSKAPENSNVIKK